MGVSRRIVRMRVAYVKTVEKYVVEFKEKIFLKACFNSKCTQAFKCKNYNVC